MNWTTYRGLARSPLRRIAQIVEGTDGLKERISCTLADTLIVMCEEIDKFDRAFLNVRQEVTPGSSEDCTNRIGGNLFLDSDGTVDIHYFIDVDILQLNYGISIGILFRKCTISFESCSSLGDGD